MSMDAKEKIKKPSKKHFEGSKVGKAKIKMEGGIWVG
jgi:hypothetical protein